MHGNHKNHENDERAAAVHAVMEAQKQIYRALHQTQEPAWLNLDLSMAQLKALMVLATQPAMNVSSLADTLQIGKPATSILVDRLVQLGYVERTEDAEDRRRTLVSPSAAGQELVTRLREGPQDRFMRWLQQMTTEDLDALVRSLDALAEIAGHDVEHSALERASALAAQRSGRNT